MIRSEASTCQLHEINTAIGKLVDMPGLKHPQARLTLEEFASRFEVLQSPYFLALEAESHEQCMAWMLYRQ